MKLNREQVKQIVSSFRLDEMKDLGEEQHDELVHEIILDCMSHEDVEPFTAKFDKLYGQYEKIIYSIINFKNDYQRGKAWARHKAIELQHANFNTAQSWGEVFENSEMLYRLGKRYGLLKEFRNEGLL